MINDLVDTPRGSRVAARIVILRLISDRHRVRDVIVATSCSTGQGHHVARRAAE
ncbi:hypothetical protein [Mycolicibacterium hodleri]|nr:hypothetical protein [Mycolicibacterium hodleri]